MEILDGLEGGPRGVYSGVSEGQVFAFETTVRVLLVRRVLRSTELTGVEGESVCQWLVGGGFRAGR